MRALNGREKGKSTGEGVLQNSEMKTWDLFNSSFIPLPPCAALSIVTRARCLRLRSNEERAEEER